MESRREKANMTAKIDIALNTLYQREISTRDQLLNEMLRVKLTQQKAAAELSKNQLFSLMKDSTEDLLGFFPADRDDFYAIYQVLNNIDPIDFTTHIYNNDRTGTVLSPSCLIEYIKQRIYLLQPKRILIPEAEKHLSALDDIINNSFAEEITLTTQHKAMALLLKLVFGESEKVNIVEESIYSECLSGEQYNYIYLVPNFGGKISESGSFITADSDGIAIENMLRH